MDCSTWSTDQLLHVILVAHTNPTSCLITSFVDETRIPNRYKFNSTTYRVLQQRVHSTRYHSITTCSIRRDSFTTACSTRRVAVFRELHILPLVNSNVPFHLNREFGDQEVFHGNVKSAFESHRVLPYLFKFFCIVITSWFHQLKIAFPYFVIKFRKPTEFFIYCVIGIQATFFSL